MAWFWTDDLARLAIEAGMVEPDAVREWMARPVAVAGPDDADPLAVAGRLLGGEAEAAGAA